MTETTKPAVANGGPGLGLRTAGNPPRAYHTPKPGGGQFVWYAGRRVASVDADHVLRRTLHSSKHVYRGGGEEAWSFHVPVVLEARRLGAQAIEVKDADTGTIYHVDLGVFLRQARPFVNEWGPQMALPLTMWDTCRARATQLSLFGV